MDVVLIIRLRLRRPNGKVLKNGDRGQGCPHRALWIGDAHNAEKDRLPCAYDDADAFDGDIVHSTSYVPSFSIPALW